ncbi:hypothetical protein [Verrucosispora sp. NA02020]|uniref:hypothetical protein n=1 Tax=Verrucosispora sp. NA02020 TaxID=2742132 RepID=UPI001591E41C|nr:hypothetical protein [Verrucosispora sp. NA02020]QKW13032.1 hypothetical protein HUT12_09650 [Verrucosispora sp. NA02020]
MDVGNSIRIAINDWTVGEYEAAMLHACNAVDGTARKEYPNEGSNSRFTRLLRENYFIFGPMGVPGIDIEATRFPVRVPHPKAPGGQPDIADVIYGIHRCSHGHGDELPDGFSLLPDAAGSARITRMAIEEGKVRLSDRTIFGLLAVAALSPVNVGQSVPLGYFLSYEDRMFPINDWWGRRDDFRTLIAPEGSLPCVKMDFGDWMQQ